MARARLLKPGFFKNEDLIDIPFEGRILFAGLWTLADRSGHLEDRPKRIKMELFPADAVDVDALLESLNAHGFIHRYTSGSQALIHIPSFLRHQSPHKNEPASTAPPCGCETEEDGALREPHGAAPVMPGARPAVTSNRYTDNGDPVTGDDSTGAVAPRVSHKPIDEKFLAELQDANPGVNVQGVYERAQNRKTWDGYKDKRRALKEHVGYALAERTSRNGRDNVVTAQKARAIAGLKGDD